MVGVVGPHLFAQVQARHFLAAKRADQVVIGAAEIMVVLDDRGAVAQAVESDPLDAVLFDGLLYRAWLVIALSRNWA